MLTPVECKTVDARPTAVVSQTTTWKQFPGLWRHLLDEVYVFVRPRPELSPEDGPEVWRNVFLYVDDQPTVEIGVLAATSFEPHGRVVPSQLPGGEVATAVHRGDYAEMGRTHQAVNESSPPTASVEQARRGRSTGTGTRIPASSRPRSITWSSVPTSAGIPIWPLRVPNS